MKKSDYQKLKLKTRDSILKNSGMIQMQAIIKKEREAEENQETISLKEPTRSTENC